MGFRSSVFARQRRIIPADATCAEERHNSRSAKNRTPSRRGEHAVVLESRGIPAVAGSILFDLVVQCATRSKPFTFFSARAPSATVLPRFSVLACVAPALGLGSEQRCLICPPWSLDQVRTFAIDNLQIGGCTAHGTGGVFFARKQKSPPDLRRALKCLGLRGLALATQSSCRRRPRWRADRRRASRTGQA